MTVIIIMYWRLVVAPSTAQGHLRAFHKFQSYISPSQLDNYDELMNKINDLNNGQT